MKSLKWFVVGVVLALVVPYVYHIVQALIALRAICQGAGCQ